MRNLTGEEESKPGSADSTRTSLRRNALTVREGYVARAKRRLA